MAEILKDRKWSGKTDKEKCEEVRGRVIDLISSLYDDGLIYICNGSEGQAIESYIYDDLKKHIDI